MSTPEKISLSGTSSPSSCNSVRRGGSAASSSPHLLKRSRLFISPTQIHLLLQKRNQSESDFTQLLSQAIEIITLGGRELKFPIKTIGTAMLLMQHFYLFNSGILATSLETACACLLVSSKIEDTPKKSKDIITHVLSLKGPTPQVKLEETRIRVLSLERHILETLGFDFRQNSPQYYVMKMSKDLKVSREVAKVAWTISIDAFARTIYLHVPAHTVALACIILAVKLFKDESLFPLDSSRFYSTRYKTNVILLELLDLYIEKSSHVLELPKHPDFDSFLEICLAFRANINEAVSNYQKNHSDAFQRSLSVDNTGDLTIRAGKISDEGAVRYVLGWDK